MMEWTFGDLRTFFHEDEAPTSTRFERLFDAMMRAHDVTPEEVEEAWLPYALEMLSSWPDAQRCWNNGAWRDDEVETFLEGAHPLHALGRYMYIEDASPDKLVAYCQTPDLVHLRSLSFFWCEGLTAAHLKQALTGLQGTNLEHLGFAYIKLDDACAEALTQATHLEGLRALNLTDHAMSPGALRALVSAPHFAGLEHLSFGTMEEVTRPHITLQRELMERLPKLLTTLSPTNGLADHAITPTWRTHALPWEGSNVRERVDLALEIYRAANGDTSEYPFLGPDFHCYGGYVELSAEDFARPDLTLPEIYPRYEEVSGTDNFDTTSIHVVATQKGALDASFDEDGTLTDALELRALAKLWLEPPRGAEPDAYGGACLLQTVFAQQGLCLDEDDNGVLRLTPQGGERGSALVRFWRAFHQSQSWVGGWLIDYCCTPWYEPLGGVITTGKMRAIVVWEEHEHMFDARGELTSGGQPMSITGDGVALLRALEGEGFVIEGGRWESSVVVCES